ncbi:MAG: scramblase [Alphaproteobacteria bacterium]|nr:scramblase [Alphaproteobacteria bacterium]
MSFDRIVSTRSRLLVRQAREWAEILIGFESRNKYDLCDDDGRVVGHAAEEGNALTAVLMRNLLGRRRPASFHIYDADRAEVAVAKKPFTFYFHRVTVTEGGQAIGEVRRRFSLLNRTFDVVGPGGRTLATIKSRLFRIWTFKVLVGGREVGRISKRWGGALKEIFTDADTFGVEFGDSGPELRKLLLAATFLIDFTCFEENDGNKRGLLGMISDD